MDYQSFIQTPKSLLIAPAGYGKTHAISECLKLCENHQLILTHTHAGIASIKDKLRNSNIPNNRYTVETISGFAQRYCLSFYVGEIPDQSDKKYHYFMVTKFIELIKRKLIQKILLTSYNGIFIDEYQDCSPEQHEMSMKLSELLFTRIFGDPLQGIFEFSGANINFEKDLNHFTKFSDLTTPHRWNKNNRVNLGLEISRLRGALSKKENIDLSEIQCDNFHFFNFPEKDKFNPSSDYFKYLKHAVNNPQKKPELDSLLILYPTFEVVQNGHKVPQGNVHQREKIRKLIDPAFQVTLLEAIDDKQFYSLAKECDNLISVIPKARKPIKKLSDKILLKLFTKTSLEKWITGNRTVDKRNKEEGELSRQLSCLISEYIQTPQSESLSKIIKFLKYSLNIKPKRLGLFNTLLNCLKMSKENNVTVEESMKNSRNVLRRVGRKITGKSIGTTLLTKGLEFDTVFILDAHLYQCPKHFYVAVSRCCKKLIIVSEKEIISPFS
jgi:DNA helicase-2/ATP-dependent DNA helicase PcrA